MPEIIVLVLDKELLLKIVCSVISKLEDRGIEMPDIGCISADEITKEIAKEIKEGI